MKVTIYITVLFAGLVLFSCGPSDEEKARSKLNLAQSLMVKKETAAAQRH